MKKIMLTLCVALSLTACQSDSVREASDTRLVIESLACGESIEIFGVKPNSFRPTYLINQLEELRERHEATLAIAGKQYTMTVLVSNDQPFSKYFLTPMTPPVDYFLYVSVHAMALSPIGDIHKYLTIEKVCEKK